MLSHWQTILNNCLCILETGSTGQWSLRERVQIVRPAIILVFCLETFSVLFYMRMNTSKESSFRESTDDNDSDSCRGRGFNLCGKTAMRKQKRAIETCIPVYLSLLLNPKLCIDTMKLHEARQRTTWKLIHFQNSHMTESLSSSK